MDIVTETVNRLRLTDGEIVILLGILTKTDVQLLDNEEKRLHKILVGRLEGRIKLKTKYNDV